MITRGRSIQGLIKFDADKIQVVRVSPKGHVTLQVKYEVDLIKALQFGVTKVDIQFRKVNESSGTGVFSISSVQNPQEVLDSIRFRSSRRKKRAERVRVNRLTRKLSDITRKVDNSIAARMAKISDMKAEALLRPKRIITSVTQREIGSIAEDIPIIQTPIHYAVNGFRGQREARLASQNMIFREGRSPTSVANYETTYASTEDAIKGIMPKKLLRLEDRADSILLKWFFLSDISDVFSASDLDNSDRIPILSHRTPRKAVIVETIQLTDTFLNERESQYEVFIGALDSDGNTVDSDECTVDMMLKVADVIEPSVLQLSPGFLGLNTGGSSLLLGSAFSEEDLDTIDSTIYQSREALFGFLSGYDQIDTLTHEEIENTQGLNILGVNDAFEIWIKSSGPYLPMDESSWSQVGTVSVGGVTEILTQPYYQASKLSMISTTVVRFVGVGSRASDFAEIVFPGISNHPTSTNYFLGRNAVAETDNRFSSITAFNRNGFIEIRVSGIVTPGPVMVIRRDCTLHEKVFVPLEIDEPIQMSDGMSILKFEDTNVKEDHVYEYRAKVFTRHGRELLTTGVAIITYRLLNGTAVSIDIGTPLVTVDSSGNIDVQFSLKGEVPETGLSALNTILEKAGLSKYFDTDIKKDREKLSKLLAFQVERVDLKSGEQENFGVITSSSFSDKALRKLRNVSDLKRGRKYRYVISALLRTSDTLLDSATRTKVDTVTGKSYTFNPSRFLRPETLKRGVLPSINAPGSDLADEFNSGFAGVQQFVDISIEDNRPSIVSASVKRNSRNQNVIRWNVKGNLNLIDHFVILGTHLGMRTIVGKSHGVSSNGTFNFIDKHLSKKVGEVTYQIIPVYIDYTQGLPVQTGKIESLSDL